MEYSRATAGRMQLDDYVAEIPKIYGQHDNNRSIWDVWCHTLHHAAAVAEQIRKDSPEDNLFEEIADFSLWLLTSVQKLSGKLGERKSPNETVAETIIRIQSRCSELLWHKYPGVCPSCYVRIRVQSKNCVCFFNSDNQGVSERPRLGDLREFIVGDLYNCWQTIR